MGLPSNGFDIASYLFRIMYFENVYSASPENLPYSMLGIVIRHYW